MRQEQRQACDARRRMRPRVGQPALADVASGPARRASGVLAIVLLALACATSSPPALADFPYVGDGTMGEPASWKLAPGHTPTNIGGLAWKFAATPAPPSEPAEAVAVTKNNSQMDELGGVTGMSPLDAHATLPPRTGSRLAAHSTGKTALAVSVGRPRRADAR